jgi:hypothetical protein
MAKRAKKQSWIVTMRCTVTKQVVCENCTEEQARNDPWDFASDETEIGQDDWDVTEVKPND